MYMIMIHSMQITHKIAKPSCDPPPKGHSHTAAAGESSSSGGQEGTVTMRAAAVAMLSPSANDCDTVKVSPDRPTFSNRQHLDTLTAPVRGSSSSAAPHAQPSGLPAAHTGSTVAVNSSGGHEGPSRAAAGELQGQPPSSAQPLAVMSRSMRGLEIDAHITNRLLLSSVLLPEILCRVHIVSHDYCEEVVVRRLVEHNLRAAESVHYRDFAEQFNDMR